MAIVVNTIAVGSTRREYIQPDSLLCSYRSVAIGNSSSRREMDSHERKNILLGARTVLYRSRRSAFRFHSQLHEDRADVDALTSDTGDRQQCVRNRRRHGIAMTKHTPLGGLRIDRVMRGSAAGKCAMLLDAQAAGALHGWIAALWVRLPLQLLLVAWIWRVTPRLQR